VRTLRSGSSPISVHRLFGAAAKRIVQTSLDRVRLSAASALKDAIAQRARRHYPAESQTDAYNHAADEIEDRFERLVAAWSVELFADLIAARLLGPAYLAAFDRLFVHPQPPTESHPPNDLRRFWIARYLSQGPLKEFEDGVWSRLSPVRSPAILRDIAERLAGEVCSLVALALEPLLATVSSPRDWEGFAELIILMENHIEDLAPPSVALADLDNRATEGVWAVLYAAWHFRLDEDRFKRFCEKFGWKDHVLQGENRLGDLILQALKALELSIRHSRLGQVPV
jgi:hypothetical protein